MKNCATGVKLQASRRQAVSAKAVQGNSADRRPLEVFASQPVMAPRTQDMAGDPFGLLLRQRTIFLGGEVTDFSADAIVSQLLLLDAQVWSNTAKHRKASSIAGEALIHLLNQGIFF